MVTPVITGLSSGSFAAVDLGATSGRVVIGRVSADRLELDVVHRFANEPVRISDGLHWNILELYRQVIIGLEIAVAREPIISVGIDSWAVDYGLVRGDRLISTPFHYRDDRSAVGVRRVHEVVDPQALYAQHGLQFLSFNSLYQLAVDSATGMVSPQDSVLLIPDLLAFWLTGQQVAERTNASTTGLLDVHSRQWNSDLIKKLELAEESFPTLVDPGTVIGIAPQFGEVPVVAVGSHDTASAVAAVPAADENFAYISSGTWSLVGLELEAPVITEAARRANFTNEGGVDGRIRFLTNVSGLWLLSESIRTWAAAGDEPELATLLAQAESVEGAVATFDPADERFIPPGDMPARIQDWCREHDREVPGTPAEVVRSILQSLADAYAVALARAVELTGRVVDVVHVVGGGSQNRLLCQLTADATGRPVLAGPVEATAIGNIAVQARAAGVLTGGLEVIRDLVRTTCPPDRYVPRTSTRSTERET